MTTASNVLAKWQGKVSKTPLQYFDSITMSLKEFQQALKQANARAWQHKLAAMQPKHINSVTVVCSGEDVRFELNYNSGIVRQLS